MVPLNALNLMIGHSNDSKPYNATKSIVATNPIHPIVVNAAMSAFPTFSCQAY
jgi:hypothetical protein